LLVRFGLPVDPSSPVDLLQKLKLELYDAAKLYLHGTPTIAPTVEDPDTHEVLLLYHDDTQVRVQVSADATVSQLRQADDALQGVDEGAWVDAATSKALNDADVVRGRTIRVCPAVAGVSSDACHVDLGQLERDLPLVPAAHPLSVDTPLRKLWSVMMHMRASLSSVTVLLMFVLLWMTWLDFCLCLECSLPPWCPRLSSVLTSVLPYVKPTPQVLPGCNCCRNKKQPWAMMSSTSMCCPVFNCPGELMFGT
jgi:hypothetical protein